MHLRPRSAPAGKFNSCVSMPPNAAAQSGVSRPPWQNCECANCLWGGQGVRCSLRRDRGTFGSLLSMYTNAYFMNPGTSSSRTRSKESRHIYQENRVVRSRSLVRAGIDLNSLDGLQQALKESRTQTRAIKRRIDRIHKNLPLEPILFPSVGQQEDDDDEDEGEDANEDEDDDDEGEGAGGNASSSEDSDSLEDNAPIISHLRGRAERRRGSRS
jgi:hypothetical protein